MDIDKVVIIGGGIGGLVFAAALQQRGVPFVLYEQAPQLREVGAGIGLWSNALTVLDSLGYGAELSQLGTQVRYAEFVAPDGQVLASYELDDVLAGTGVEQASRLVHRGELLALLAAPIDPGCVVTGKRCDKVDWEAERPVAHFDGARTAADLVVGADGLWSQVRASLWGQEAPRYSGEYCWRGLARGVDPGLHYLRELQGRGRRFGIGMLDAERTYWWATWATDEDFRLEPAEYRSFLAERFAGWPCKIPELIAATPPEAIHLDALYDRAPRKSWTRGAVTLLGDAAHPTTPNLGQGACMAIEDALVLADLLAQADTRQAALARYERLRVGRTSRIVRQSRRFGRIGQWQNRLAVGLRRLAIGATPDFVMRRQLLDQIDYDATRVVGDP